MHYICLHDVYYNIHHSKYTTCNCNFKHRLLESAQTGPLKRFYPSIMLQMATL